MDETPVTSDPLGKSHDLRELYARRFDGAAAYRDAVWRVLARNFFQRYVREDARVLDVGCGYGEFINNIRAGRKFGIDLNPTARERLSPEVELFQQDCSSRWPLPGDSLDVVFTSNFFEHLPDKASLRATLQEAQRCLAPGGILIAMGPNIRYLSGAYWDFWDHSLCLTERSLAEGLLNIGYHVREQVPRFLPYSMTGQPHFPPALIRLYLGMRWVWPIFGRQFLVVAEKK